MSEQPDVIEEIAAEAAPAAAPKAKGPKLVEAIVRHGTVMVGVHGEEKPVGPGGKVLLPEDDVIALRARGVLHDPESPPSFDGGPSVDIDQVEPKVTEAKPRARKR